VEARYLLRRDLQDFGLPPHDVMRNFEQMLHRRIGHYMPRRSPEG